jgi:hypothetical protein
MLSLHQGDVIDVPKRRRLKDDQILHGRHRRL